MRKSTRASLPSSTDQTFTSMSLVSNWYVLGTGTVDGQMFAQYAEEPKQGHNAAAVMGKPILPAGSNKGN